MGDNSSVSSNVDLVKAASYAPLGERDKDKTAVDHWMASKVGVAHANALVHGDTIPFPRFKDNIDTLLQLMDFELPPLRVVRPANVVHVYYESGGCFGK
jgi:hypothetical protein